MVTPAPSCTPDGSPQFRCGADTGRQSSAQEDIVRHSIPLAAALLLVAVPAALVLADTEIVHPAWPSCAIEPARA